MFISRKIKSIEIHDKNKKSAYLKGCKILAKYIASNKYKNLSMSVKQNGIEENTFVFTIYSNIDMKKEQIEFCKNCKYFHCSFYINENYNCDRCNLKTFLKRLEEKTKISKGFYIKVINKKE